MDSTIQETEPVVQAHWLPRMPWAVSSVRVDATGTGVRVAYRLTTATAEEDPYGRRDGRNRLALEAFTALRLDEMGTAIDRYLDEIGAQGRSPSTPRLRALLDDLVTFAERFGPLGIGWASTFSVTNPVVDALEQRIDELEGRDAPDRDRSAAGRSGWRVSISEAGGGGEVQRVAAGPGRSPDTESLPGDRLADVRAEQADLRMAIDFAEVIAHNDEDSARALIRDAPWARLVSLRSIDPRGPDWRRARQTGPVTGRGKWDPLDEHEKVDWGMLARLILARLIERQLRLTSPRVVVGAGDQIRLEHHPVTALELIYRQLLDHVSERQGFGIGECGYCDGAILRTRMPTGATGNQWHDGPCGSAGRARRFRERRGKR